jgi:predicted TIM-barrel fold metal-dependent hydrolase
VRLIDTHQHLIYRDRFAYGWTVDLPVLARGNFTLADYYHLVDDTVATSIFMETGVDDTDYRNEARFVADLIAEPANRISGQIASCRPEQEYGFEGWLEEGASLGVLGYRRILHVMPDETSRQATFRRNVRSIGARGKTFDICVLARQLPVAIELAQACDGMTLVLDHCGVPDIAAGALEGWARDLQRISRLDHVICKLSGLLAYCALNAADANAIQPYVDHVLECFGPQRIVWGSDWPVVNATAGLPTWLKITQSILMQLSDDEAVGIARCNAIRCYNLNSRIICP